MEVSASNRGVGHAMLNRPGCELGARSEGQLTEHAAAGEGEGRRFRMEADAATELLGTNRAPGAIDLLLAAASASFVQSFTLHAAEQGMVIDSMVVSAEATTCPATAVGAPAADKPGLSHLVLRYAVATEAQPGEVERLAQLVRLRSPILALLADEAELRIERVASDGGVGDPRESGT